MRSAEAIILLALSFAVQLVLTVRARSTMIKCLPALLICFLMLLCFVFYALSGWTNWAWLIIMAMAGAFLVPIALGAVIGCMMNAVKKDYSVNKKHLTSVTAYAILPQVSSKKA